MFFFMLGIPISLYSPNNGNVCFPSYDATVLNEPSSRVLLPTCIQVALELQQSKKSKNSDRPEPFNHPCSLGKKANETQGAQLGK